MVKSLNTPPAPASIGRDPDGMIDNRPGIAHPARPKAIGNTTSVIHRRGDDFARNRQFGAGVVNQTNKARNSRNAKPELPVGAGIGTRNPKSVESKKSKATEKKRLYRVYFQYAEDEDEEDTVAN